MNYCLPNPGDPPNRASTRKMCHIGLLDTLIGRTSSLTSDMANASETQLNDRAYVLAAVQNSGVVLRHASEAMRADPDVALAAVRQNGRALEFVSENLRNDRKIVLAAVGRWAIAL